MRSKDNKNYMGILAGIAIAVSAFLPFVSVDMLGIKASVSLIDYKAGIIVLALAAIGIVFSVFGINIVVAIDGGLSTLLFLFENYAIGREVDSDLYTGIAKALLDKGIGYYMLLAGSVILLLAGIFGIRNKK